MAGALLGAGVATLAYRKRALTLDGALAAAVVGCITFARGEWPGTGALLAFFGSSSALSRIEEQRKRAQPLAQAKGARRDAWQVLANGGIATLSLMLGSSNAAIGAYAAAAADTWATELGLLARTPPRLVTTLRTVAPGTSGGVTAVGLAASCGGALCVAVTARALGAPNVSSSTAAGIVGALVDSLLGATLQASYVCPRCETPTEEPVHNVCGAATERQRGVAWMNNDAVNALATLSGAIVAALLGKPNAAGHVRGGS